jgi:hypothetical protein
MPVTSSSALSAPQQLLLRLPGDLAQRFAQVVPSRQRSKYVLELLRQALDGESQSLAKAAQDLSTLESGNKVALAESHEWMGAALNASDDLAFDAATFEHEFALAQAKLANA